MDLSIAFSTSLSVSAGARGVPGSNVQVSPRRGGVVTMGPWKKGEKDEAFRLQQEILERRRNKKSNNEHFQTIEERRRNIEEYYDKRRLKVPIGEDPLIAWKKMKDEGLIDESQYTAMDEGGIPIPMASFGIPKYDNGGRFDLRLPHVEVGYTDDDADVMAKAGRAFKNMFGFGKKEKEEKESKKDSEVENDTQQ